MIQPGRESAASLEVATVSALPERPEPPVHLTEEEATEWRSIVATKPADWFMRDSQPVLTAYCQSVVMHRDLMALWHLSMTASKSGNLEEWLAAAATLKDLSTMVTKAANLVAQLATKLRLTQQSRYTPKAANTANNRTSGSKLWQKP